MAHGPQTDTPICIEKTHFRFCCLDNLHIYLQSGYSCICLSLKLFSKAESGEYTTVELSTMEGIYDESFIRVSSFFTANHIAVLTF